LPGTRLAPWRWPAGRLAGDVLEALAPDQWVDLRIVRSWPAATVIEAGQPFAIRKLAPLRLDRPTGRGL
jgi:hypothetical protein